MTQYWPHGRPLGVLVVENSLGNSPDTYEYIILKQKKEEMAGLPVWFIRTGNYSDNIRSEHGYGTTQSF